MAHRLNCPRGEVWKSERGRENLREGKNDKPNNRQRPKHKDKPDVRIRDGEEKGCN